MKKLLLSCVSVLLGITVMAQGSANLKLNLEKNKVYRIKSISENTLTQTMNGMQQTTNIASNSTISIKMVDAKPEFLVAEVKFDTLVTNTNAMGKKSTISSLTEGNIASKEVNDVMSCIQHRLSKTSLFVKLDYSGKVLEIVNAKMVTEAVLKDTALITGDAAPVIKMQIKNNLTEKALISNIEAFTHGLPNKQVSTGEKWQTIMNTNAGGMSLDFITAYALDGLKGNVATLTAESTIKASDNAEPINYGPAKVSYNDLKGSGKSNVVVDTRTGLIIANTTKTHIAGNLNVSVQGMNLDMPMEMDGETKVIGLP